jgi:lysophospholipase L1-like esterase
MSGGVVQIVGLRRRDDRPPLSASGPTCRSCSADTSLVRAGEEPVGSRRRESTFDGYVDRGHEPRRRGAVRSLLREVRSWPTIALVSFCLVLGIPVTIALTPAQDVVAAGQPLAVGARPPTLSLSGPAQLVQIGNTKLDLPALNVYGPLRPKLEIGPAQRTDATAKLFDPGATGQVQGQALAALRQGFVDWYLWGAAVLLAFTLAAAAAVGCLRMLVILRRQSRAGNEHHRSTELCHDVTRGILRMTLIALIASTLAWGAAGWSAYTGTVQGLEKARSLTQLVGATTITPAPAGPEILGYRGAVIGDSRAVRVGGPPVPDPNPSDVACERSTDSLAAEAGRLLDVQVLNLACPCASIASGLRGPQEHRGQLVPPQLGRLKQVRDLQFVVVAIGPNDLGWADFLAYCYAVENCADNLTQGEFDYRLAAFDREYGALLADLADLPGSPDVIVMTSYDVFSPGADCADTQGPSNVAGLSQAEITMLDARNAALNSILAAGAEKYGFAVAHPPLTPLCEVAAGTPDLQGLGDADPFHPTAVGSLRMAAAVVRWIPPNAFD